MQVGDVVQLKSGGPPMIVEEGPRFDYDSEVVVTWLNQNNEIQTYRFPVVCLNPYEAI